MAYDNPRLLLRGPAEYPGVSSVSYRALLIALAM